MYGEPPEPPDWVIDLQIFEDNVKKGYARIKKHIKEIDKRLDEKRKKLHRPEVTAHDVRDFERDEAFLAGMYRALQHLIDTMGTEESFEDDFWKTHSDDV